MTRRLTAVVLAALLVVVAGCGGGKSSSGTSLDDKLGYLPKDAPVVAVIDTNPDSGQFRNLDKLASRFLFADQIKTQIKESVSQAGVDFDKDVKPLLGGQLVIGSTDAKSLTDSQPRDAYVVVWGVKDGGKLRDLIRKQGKSKESGKVAGEAAFESSDGSVVVVKGDVLVGASDRPTLQAALDRKGGGDKLTQTQFDGAFGDLPNVALVRVYGDLQKLLEADPATATARQVKWVAGLRTFGITLTAENDGPAVDARINTDGLAANDLPLAPGDEAPRVARIGELGVGLRNAHQLVTFVQNTLRAVDPAQSQSLESGKKALGRAAGIDVDSDLIAQLTGATSFSGGVDGGWAIRSEPKDPAALAKSLDRLRKKGKVGKLRFAAAGDLIQLTDKNGNKFYFGMVGQLLVASPDLAKAKAAAVAQPQAVPRAKGSLVAIADGKAIVKALVAGRGGGALGGQLASGPVGDLTAWLTTSPDGMRGRIKLKVN